MTAPKESITLTPGWLQILGGLFCGLVIGGLFVGRLMFAPAGDYATKADIAEMNGRLEGKMAGLGMKLDLLLAQSAPDNSRASQRTGRRP